MLWKTLFYTSCKNTLINIILQIHPAAIRCFLACIGPTGNKDTWTSSVIDAFKVAIEKFEFFSISLHGKSVNDSLPVILWGMAAEKAKAFSPQLFQYTNINNSLVQYGYVHLKEKFQPLSAAESVEDELSRYYKAFDQFFEDINVEVERPMTSLSLDDSCDMYQVRGNVCLIMISFFYLSLPPFHAQDDITDEVTPIERWLPAKPIDKAIFVGVPTYVDNNGIIYLHDVDKERVLEMIKKVINAKYETSQQHPSDKFYAVGEPCMARFHIDEKFYRAIIRQAVNSSKYKVQFVDYGNIEECDLKDIRKNIICGRVPALVNKYRLTDVAPRTANGIWSTEALDTLHSLIVGKQCQVRVDTDMDTDAAGTVPCFLKVTGECSTDVSEYLLQTKLVEKKYSVFEEKVDELFDPYTNAVDNQRSSLSSKESRLRIAANFGAESATPQKADSGSEDVCFFSVSSG